ncbi:MAG: response regulator [Gemmataceae bacterium]|nr:response regulator [Gemmataceae bacterium]
MSAVKEKKKDYSILIADDDGGCRDAIRDLLVPEGFQAYSAASGEEAVDIVQAQPVHLVLFDMHMPSMTGLEALRLARQFNALLPAILVTADATESLVRQAIAAQVFSVVPKPVSKGVLLYTVVRALRRAYGAA